MGFESGDAGFFFYAKGRYATSLWKVPVNGGEETRVLESLLGCEEFVITETGIYFIPALPSGTGSFSVQFFRFATGKVTPIATIENPSPQGLSVHPDGQWIVYSQIDYRGSELMLVDNFR